MPFFLIIVHTTSQKLSCVRHYDMFSMEAGYQYFRKLVDKGMNGVVYFNCMMVSVMSPVYKEYKEIGLNSWKIEPVLEPWSVIRREDPQ